MPPPQPQRPSVSPSTCSAWKPLVCLCGRRRGGQQRLCRPGAGTAGPPAASLALSCAPLSCGSSQHPQKRPRRGRPPQAEAPQVAVRSRLVGRPEALLPSEDAYGWMVLATTLRSEEWTDGEMLQADQARHITVEPGFRWRKPPAAISPVWREQPARIAALARLTGGGARVGGDPTAGPPVSPRP